VDGIPVHRVGLPGTNAFSTLIYTISLVLYLIKKGKTANVIHTHGAAALGAVGSLCARITRTSNIALIGTAGRITKLNKNIIGRMILELFKKSDAIICLSNEIGKELEDIGASSHRIFRIGNAVDAERFRPLNEDERRSWRVRRGFGPKDPIIVFSGRLVYRKGLDMLLAAWPKITASHSSAHLIILGSGKNQPDTIEEEMRQKVIKDGIINATFEGEVSSADSYFGIADILALPSRKEGLPNVLLEAMSSELASVCFRIGGVTDLIENGQTGLLVPAGDIVAFSNAIINLLDDQIKRKIIGKQARHYVATRHRLEQIAGEYFTVYGLIQPKRG